MWMAELTTNTSTADTRMGSHSANTPVMSTSTYCGCRTVRRYGLCVLNPCGYFFFASSSETEAGMMTSWPGFQFTGVATVCSGRELHRVEQPQHLVEVAPRAHRIDDHRFHFLVRPDHEHRAHGGVVRRGAFPTGRVGVNHVVQLGDGQVGVADEGVVDRVALRFLDVAKPALVIAHEVRAQADYFRVTLV